MNNIVDIIFLQDRSGSIKDILSESTYGLRDFVTKQQNEADVAYFTLIMFDSQDPHEVIIDRVPIRDVDVSSIIIEPRGGTPLNDAFGYAILAEKERIDNLPEDQRPGKVIFILNTDGKERHSTKYTANEVCSMVDDLRTSRQWEFIFTGVGIDEFDAVKLGITRDQIIVNRVGDVKAGYSEASQTLSSIRKTYSRELNL